MGTNLTSTEILQCITECKHKSWDYTMRKLAELEKAKKHAELTKQISVSHWGVYGGENV